MVLALNPSSRDYAPTLAKVDCEGCEFTWLRHVLDTGLIHLLPSQIDFEMHRRLMMWGHPTMTLTKFEEGINGTMDLFRRLWLEAGFAAIDSRIDDGGCEITLARIQKRIS